VHFVFSPPAQAAAGLLDLPWHEPLEDWQDDRLTEIPQRGISRHVVRFVAEEGELFALKEIPEQLARREYTLLRQIKELGVPAVDVLGLVVERPDDLDAVLVTRFLDYSSSFRALFASPRGAHMTDRLLDAQVELLARLHLAGVMWGDCSLSNTLFRFDAGALAAYLVDAETAEVRQQLSRGQREYDLDLAHERVAGELMDLQAGELLSEEVDPIDVADDLVRRYHDLWHELTDEQVIPRHEQRYRIAERIRRLNELGFDIDEVDLIDEPGGGSRLRFRTRVAEPGHHRHRLMALTGLDVWENQARRLLADIASFRGRRLPVAVGGLRADRGRHPAAPAHPAGPGGDLPRDPRAPLVPVRGRGRRRRQLGGGDGLLRPGAAGGAGGPGDARGGDHRPRRRRARGRRAPGVR
jgi:hypothetical protein